MLNFDEFKLMLSDYRKNIRGNSSTRNNIVYERAEFIPLKLSNDFTDKKRYVINFDREVGGKTGVINYDKSSPYATGDDRKYVFALNYTLQ